MISCLKGNVLSGWERKTTPWQIPFYTCSAKNIVQWDHPEFLKIMESLDKFEKFKYAAYRAAFKFRGIQKALKFNLIDLPWLKMVFEEFELNGMLSSTDFAFPDVEKLLHHLYSKAKCQLSFVEDPFTLAQLMWNFLLNVFSLNRDRSVLMLQVKIALVLMCSDELTDKYKYLFLLCSKDSLMTKDSLHILLNSLSLIAEALGEKLQFGVQLVPFVLENYVQWHDKTGKISENGFLDWLSLEPQTLVWISTYYRISLSETTEHLTRCAICETSPFFGLRYKCLYCMGYSLCQYCFLSGLSNKNHTVKHAVLEYCQTASLWEEIKSTFISGRNKLYRTKRSNKGCINIDDLQHISKSSNDNQERIKCQENLLFELACNSTSKELFSIVVSLEQTNRYLWNDICKLQPENISNEFLCMPKTGGLQKTMLLTRQEVMEDHCNQLDLLLQKLKLFLQDLDYVAINPNLPEGKFMSPKVEPLINERENYCESTPAIVNAIKSSEGIQNNLSMYIKLHSVPNGIAVDSQSMKAYEQVSQYSFINDNCTFNNLGSTNFLQSESNKFHDKKDSANALVLEHSQMSNHTVFEIGDLTPGYSTLSKNETGKNESVNFENSQSTLRLVDTELHIILRELDKLFPKTRDSTNGTSSMLQSREKILNLLAEIAETVNYADTRSCVDSSNL